jgi:hypothetical protein
LLLLEFVLLAVVPEAELAPLLDAARVDRLEPLRLDPLRPDPLREDPLRLDADRFLLDALRELELDLFAALLVELDPLVPFLVVEPDLLVPFLDVEREADVSDRFACERPRLVPRRDWPD